MTITRIDEIRSRVLAGDLTVIQDMAVAGVDLNVELGHGQTALMLAANRGLIDIVHALVRSGASINAIGEYGMTALHEAASSGHAQIVVHLLNAGATVNSETVDEITPLMCAASWRFIEVARALLEHGADIERRAARGDTAYDIAGEKGEEKMVEFLKDQASRRGHDVS